MKYRIPILVFSGLALAASGIFVLNRFVDLQYLLTGLPSRRHIVRENPLAAPIIVVEITERGLLLEDGRRIALAGIEWPEERKLREQAISFVQMATRQGIEIIREIDKTRSIIRCEPQFNHWCGNDPVAASYEQFNLNELLLCSGFVKIDEKASGISEEEWKRFRACQLMAQDWEWGHWNTSETESNQIDYDPVYGLGLSNRGINHDIEYYLTIQSNSSISDR